MDETITITLMLPVTTTYDPNDFKSEKKWQKFKEKIQNNGTRAYNALYDDVLGESITDHMERFAFRLDDKELAKHITIEINKVE